MALRSTSILFILGAVACSTEFQSSSDAGSTSGASGGAGASAGGSSGAGASGASGGVGGTSGGSGGAGGGAAGKGGSAGTGGVAGAGGKAGSSGTGGSAGNSGSAGTAGSAAGGAAGKAGGAGAGGNAGTAGGAAGSGGVAGGAGKDGGNTDAKTDRAIDDCGCVGEGIKWGPNGGHVAYVDTSSLSPCKTFVHERNPVLTDPPTLTCTQELTACATSITAAQVAQALGHPDVQTAIAAAPVLYGRDMRPVDGTVLRILIGNAMVEIGTPCSGMTGCVPIPVGVEALATLLRNLTLQELERPPCRDTFRPG